jgi:hypothetical protein
MLNSNYCQILFVAVLGVSILSVAMPSVITMSVVTVSVVAPQLCRVHSKYEIKWNDKTLNFNLENVLTPYFTF